ncbi:MAG: glycosyltransferase family 2 protein [Firmicutes bacterium]|nr:glycosyltransferase family 2 protein [Bacillota bacterium]
MQRNKISVIVPTLNEEANLGRLLERLAGEEGLEVIVSDGGSTDRTGEIAREWGVTLVNGPAGRGRQLNQGIEASSAEILLFLHADSDWEKGLFDEVRQAVTDDQAWGCCTLRFSENTLFFRLVAAGSNLRVRLFSSCYGDQGIYCSRRLLAQAGGFPETPFMEDLILSSRLRRISRAGRLKSVMVTSTRRFRKHGPLRTLLKMQTVKLLYLLGVPLSKLINFYEGRGKRA